jgi:hypothetical protein
MMRPLPVMIRIDPVSRATKAIECQHLGFTAESGPGMNGCS